MASSGQTAHGRRSHLSFFYTNFIPMIQLIWLLLILAEVARNYYVINIQKRNPDHGLALAVRAVLGAVFWILSPLISPAMRPDQWWALPIMMFFTFGVLFNLGLNIARKRPYWYLGGKSKIDLWQRDHGGAFAWFWWRLFLAMGSVSLFWRGLDALSQYPGPEANYFL
jgi:hypothetical protein